MDCELITSPVKNYDNEKEMENECDNYGNNDNEEASVNTKELMKEQEDKELAQALTAEEYLMRPEIQLLEYEKQMFLDMVTTDGLIVCAKGLSYDKVLLHIINAYSDAGNLILIINSSDWEENLYKQHVEKKFLHEVATTAAERERVYLEGGIQFITTRILVVDLLKQRIPIELITGIIVLRSHTIIESCQEAFALRLYRQHNKTGFIKAFSNSPESFTIGYNHIERIMRNLFVKELYIWPRFHAIVQKCLKSYEVKTIELHIPLSDNMKLIQSYILDIMNYLIREIKRINRFVDMEEITVENCVTKKFHKILQAQLDCIWHQLNTHTKLLVADLKILRNLMISTMYNDAVSAYALTKRYRTTEYALSNSGWTLLDAAEQIFKLAKSRVYNEQGEFEPEPCPKWKYLSELLQIEIPGDWLSKKVENICEQPKVLILCQDSRTCFQLQQYLTQSGERYLLYMAMQQQVPIGKLSKKFERIPEGLEVELTQKCKKNLKDKATDKSSTEDDKAALDKENVTQIDDLLQLLTRMEEEEENPWNYQDSYMLTMTQKVAPSQQNEYKDEEEKQQEEESVELNNANENLNDCSVFEPFPELSNLDITAVIATQKQPLICLQTFKTEREGSKVLDRVLSEIQPHYVIMYHCNVTAIRQLEVYEARLRRPLKERMKVFFLIHNQTVEEQSYLTCLRREKQAFEFIIETKSKMVIPEYQDGKTDEAFILYKSYKNPEVDITDNTKSRKAGGQVQNQITITPKIIVDMREFRSDLPCLIHKRGLEVVPVTITIGDYILTPEICVERKSISDLIGSLNSGRLYNQCIQMQRYYAKPILLIEFDQNKPFHLQSKYMLSQNTMTTNSDIVQKLQLLTIHFPRLRLIWSPSPYATAQLFEELKSGKTEPDPKQAALIGANNNDDDDGRGGGNFDDLKYFNNNIYDFLLRLPGITTRNIHKVMRYGQSLKEMLKKSEAELSELLDSPENAKLLWSIMHVMHLPEKDEVSGSAAMLAANRQARSSGGHSKFRRYAAAAEASRIGIVRGLMRKKI